MELRRVVCAQGTSVPSPPVFLEENKAVDFRQFLVELMYLVMIRNLE